MPHLLIAGNADSGKSVCINSMLLSMLYKFGPNELKLILADPKIVDMQPYRKLPHLLCPLLTAPERVIGALRWVVNEMEHRLNLFQLTGVSNVEEFNNRANDGGVAPYTEETTEQADIDSDSLPAKLPYIVIIINELADYMMLVKEDLENYIARLTQKARAAGIHLIAATQIPRANVITGILKANIPSRMAFKVTSPLDSRIILDTSGADKLLGKGDFLYLPAGDITKMTRIQGAFVSDVEVACVAKHCAEHNAAEIAPTPKDCGLTLSAEEEELYERAVQLVKNERKASVSMLQRRFSIGYGRAAKIIDMMESRGVIGPVSGNSSRPREVLI
jgi:S-DNA-T family DNA segregation ATPase FtsK/SpoIIIE